MIKPSILVVDDEPVQVEILDGFLKKEGYTVYSALNGADAINIAENENVRIVLTDYQMPDKTGIDVLKEVKKISPEIEVILFTAFGTIERAVEAMREGAYDYLSKPINLDEMLLLVKRITRDKQILEENKTLRAELKREHQFESIISKNKKVEEVLNTAATAAKSKASILIRGESGTGKELLAKAVHLASIRNKNPFIIINCASLNENLFESELFGHEKGSYTGADRQRTGRFEEADSGTVFIDEVGDIPLSMQVKLLRVLQEGEFQRVGGNKTIKADIRFVSATNRKLEDLINSGEFREDFFYRINVITLELPPLRERKEDLHLLTEFFVNKFSEQTGKKLSGISESAIQALMKYNFPGNIRELQNIIERAVVLSREEMINIEDLPPHLADSKEQAYLSHNESLTSRMESIEKQLIVEAMQKAGNVQTKAADILGINERNLRYKLKKYGIK